MTEDDLEKLRAWARAKTIFGPELLSVYNLARQVAGMDPDVESIEVLPFHRIEVRHRAPKYDTVTIDPPGEGPKRQPTRKKKR